MSLFTQPVNRIETRNVRQAYTTVHLADGNHHVISAKGWCQADYEFSMSAEQVLKWRLNRDGFLILNNGSMVPLCQIYWIEAIQTRDYYVKYRVEGYTSMLEDNLSYTKISEGYEP